MAVAVAALVKKALLQRICEKIVLILYKRFGKIWVVVRVVHFFPDENQVDRDQRGW